MAEDGRSQTTDDMPAGPSFEGIEEPRTEDASTESAAPSEATVAAELAQPSYEVGYKRPPKATRIKPGEHRNPKGRPRGSLNQKTMIERALNRKVGVSRGDKTSNVTYLEAMTETLARKAVQGDVKAAGVLVNLATKAGILGDRISRTENEGTEPVVLAAGDVRPSDKLVESVDPKLLSKDEKIDLSRIAEKIDADGDVIDLSGDDFARLQRIMNKGRRKNIAPKVDNDKVDNDNLDQAA